MVTRQEMHRYVCGQCTSNTPLYRGPAKRPVYSWAQGLQVENMLTYYDATQCQDRAHVVPRASVLKAQHPACELWHQGIHARSGVAGADCRFIAAEHFTGFHAPQEAARLLTASIVTSGPGRAAPSAVITLPRDVLHVCTGYGISLRLRTAQARCHSGAASGVLRSIEGNARL